MTTTNLLLLAGVLLFVACYVYVYFGAKRLARMRNARLDGQAEASPAAPAAAVPTPAAEAAPSPFLVAPDGPADDLGKIKGIGPKLSALLAELGVFHYRQIADWTPEQLALVDSRLGNFQGRPERDQWQSQARLLAAGDTKAYERVHGKLGPAEPPAAG
jgi:predicted flap endonuclease-1-like 5' DNA nuclease